jgi:hypothetical protein
MLDAIGHAHRGSRRWGLAARQPDQKVTIVPGRDPVTEALTPELTGRPTRGWHASGP